jgi:hypothetical protein
LIRAFFFKNSGAAFVCPAYPPMKNAKKSFFLAGFFLMLILGFGLYVSFTRGLGDRITEKILNQNTRAFFQGSIRISRIRLDRKWHLHLDRFNGNLLTDAGAIPLEMGSMVSTGPVWGLFQEKGLELNFTRFRPSNSLNDGMNGICHIRAGNHWFFELKVQLVSLDLEDIVWFNTDVLKGSKGEMKGEITILTKALEEPRVHADIHIAKPGGRLQSRFFDGIVPYLPQTKARSELKKLASQTELVNFDDAILKLDLSRTDKIKVFLHIMIPDYNLNLNLNIEVRIDEKNALLELGQIMGLVKIKVVS